MASDATWLARWGGVVALASLAFVNAADVKVANADEFRAAVAAAQPGARILLAPGVYRGGFHFTNLRGAAGKPIVIGAQQPQQPPEFRDAGTGLQLSNPAFVELEDLAFRHLTANGLNIDDGGSGAPPESTHHIALRRLRVADIGSDGNHDGIKLSGVWDFTVSGCTIERWGTKGGSAIDMVGCHRGLIDGNTFRHIEPEPANCTGVQAKGGSSEIAIRRNRFEHAGGRAVNIGGSTGRAYFRPALSAGGEHAEARDIRVEGNTFVGAVTPIGFVGVDGAVVRYNTILAPGRWAMRILQENRSEGFVACRGGQFTDNVIVFDAAHWAEGGVNIGPGVAVETFRFARNWWYCRDDAARSRPRLPVPETDGTYGRPPDEAAGKAGADAWREEKTDR